MTMNPILASDFWLAAQITTEIAVEPALVRDQMTGPMNST